MAKGNLKVGDPVKLPYTFTPADVIQIVVETVNEVTGVVEQVKLIKADGKTEVMEVADVIVVSVNIIYRIISWFARLFKKT